MGRASLFVLLAACHADPGVVVRTPCDACDGACVEDVLPLRGRTHVTGDVVYADAPPASGDHHACWAEWGVHADVVTPEQWVHNLEHGGVAFLHQCSGCDEDVATLSALVQGLDQGRALLTAYDDETIEQPFAAVAWQHRLLLGCVDTAALTDFFDANVGHGPEDTPAPPGCMDVPATP